MRHSQIPYFGQDNLMEQSFSKEETFMLFQGEFLWNNFVEGVYSHKK